MDDRGLRCKIFFLPIFVRTLKIEKKNNNRYFESITISASHRLINFHLFFSFTMIQKVSGQLKKMRSR